MRIDTPLIPDEARRETGSGQRAGKDTSFEKTMQLLERDMWAGARAGKVGAAPPLPSRPPRHDIADARVDDHPVHGAMQSPSPNSRAAVAVSRFNHAVAAPVVSADTDGAVRPGKQAAGDHDLVLAAPIPTGEPLWRKTSALPADRTSEVSQRHAVDETSRSGPPSQQHDASDRVSLVPGNGGVSVIARFNGSAADRAQMLRTILAELRRHGTNVTRLIINGVELANPPTMEEYDER